MIKNIKEYRSSLYHKVSPYTNTIVNRSIRYRTLKLLFYTTPKNSVLL